MAPIVRFARHTLTLHYIRFPFEKPHIRGLLGEVKPWVLPAGRQGQGRPYLGFDAEGARPRSPAVLCVAISPRGEGPVGWWQVSPSLAGQPGADCHGHRHLRFKNTVSVCV